jgi:hypothetical protein
MVWTDRMERVTKGGVCQLAMSAEAVAADVVATVPVAAAVVIVVVVVVVVAAAAAEIVVVEIAAEQIVAENTEARSETWYGNSECPCVGESNWEVKDMGDCWGKHKKKKERRKGGEIDV